MAPYETERELAANGTRLDTTTHYTTEQSTVRHYFGTITHMNSTKVTNATHLMASKKSSFPAWKLSSIGLNVNSMSYHRNEVDRFGSNSPTRSEKR